MLVKRTTRQPNISDDPCPLGVVRDLNKMLAPVDLDDKFRFPAREVGKEPIDRDLTPELETAKLPVAQDGPQLPLAAGRLLAKIARAMSAELQVLAPPHR
jgi:hypothetical protein